MNCFAPALAALTTLGMGSIALADAAQDIAALSETFEAAFNSGDAAGVAQHYTQDAVLLAPDTPRIEGREGIRGLWQGFIDAGATDLDLVTVDVVERDDIANELGMFTLSAPDGNGGMTELSGKYIVVWKKDGDGAWKLHWDIWNSTPGQ